MVDAQTKLPAAPLPAPEGPLTISDLAKLINDKVAQMVSSARTTRQDRPDVGRGGTDAAPQWRSTAQKEIRVTQDEGDGNERTRTRTRT